MATYTSTQYLVGPRSVHAGVNSQTFRYNLGATAASAGDIVLLAKLPVGATITELVEHHTTGATACTVSFGYTSSQTTTYSAFISAGAQATMNRLGVAPSSTGGLGYTVTLSDDATQRFATLTAKLVESGTGTTSLIITGNIQYTIGD